MAGEPRLPPMQQLVDPSTQAIKQEAAVDLAPEAAKPPTAESLYPAVLPSPSEQIKSSVDPREQQSESNGTTKVKLFSPLRADQ